MKYLKLFESYTESDIAKICKKYGIKNWSINSEGLVDVDGDVILSYKHLTKLPLYFGHVSGHFHCKGNKLTSLEGCPKLVNGGFYCHFNKLNSLQGGPQIVGGDFYCHENKLTNLEGCPQSIVGDFDCAYNKLTSLEGCPQSVGGKFNCPYNKLTSLEGGPQEVGGDFYCYMNRLTSLRFAPEEVDSHVSVLPNPISDIPERYLNEEYLQFIVKEQPDWRLYSKDGSMRLDRLEQMIEWGIETNKIKPL